MTITLTIVGDARSGKTIFLCGAYRELQSILPESLKLELVSTTAGTAHLAELSDHFYATAAASGTRLSDTIARTTDYSDCSFDLRYKDTLIARIHLFDYPGGDLKHRRDSRETEFRERLPGTDGVMFVADGYQMRQQAIGGAEAVDRFPRILRYYHDAIETIAARNRGSRIVPTALIVTKADEFYDEQTGVVDRHRINESLAQTGLSTIQQPCREFTTWLTSAITRSMMSQSNVRPFVREPHAEYVFAPGINPQPSGCALPLLWVITRALRWNVPILDNMRDFLAELSGAAKQRAEAIAELDRLFEKDGNWQAVTGGYGRF